MKKITKTLVTVVCLVALCLGAFALAACGGNEAKTGEAYALTHGAGYVGYSKITVKDNKIADVVLTEVCFPTQVKFTGTGATNEDAAAALPATPEGMTTDDFAVVFTGEETKTATAYYKTVTYGDVTMVFDVEANTYKVGTQTIKEYLANEANCKAYYEAVIGNKIKVGAAKKEGLLTRALLSKEENGYWTRKDKDNNDYSRWKWNRDATVAYVKANGVAGLATLAKAEEANTTDPADANVKAWVDGNSVSTGATWSDMWKAEAPANYLTYAQLLTKAYEAAK